MALSTMEPALAIYQGLRDRSGNKDDDAAEWVTLDEIASMPQDYDMVWQNAYDAYALKGFIPGATVPVSSPGFIGAFFRNVMSGAYSSADQVYTEMAWMFANYWDSVYVGGVQAGSDPAHDGVEVVVVVNDAIAHHGAFEAAIRAHVQKINSVRTKPYIKTLLDDVEVVVKSLTWTVTEHHIIAGAKVPIDHPDKIS